MQCDETISKAAESIDLSAAFYLDSILLNISQGYRSGGRLVKVISSLRVGWTRLISVDQRAIC